MDQNGTEYMTVLHIEHIYCPNCTMPRRNIGIKKTINQMSLEYNFVVNIVLYV